MVESSSFQKPVKAGKQVNFGPARVIKPNTLLGEEKFPKEESEELSDSQDTLNSAALREPQ